MGEVGTAVPEPVRSPEREISQEMIDTLVAIGGFPHPLFHPTAEQRARGVSAPLMGQGVLLLAGGLAEQTGTLDDVIALVELSHVRFRTMVRAGARVRLEMQLLGTATTPSGRRRSEYRWVVRDGHGQVVLEATAVMLREPEPEPGRESGS